MMDILNNPNVKSNVKLILGATALVIGLATLISRYLKVRSILKDSWVGVVRAKKQSAKKDLHYLVIGDGSSSTEHRVLKADWEAYKVGDELVKRKGKVHTELQSYVTY